MPMDGIHIDFWIRSTATITNGLHLSMPPAKSSQLPCLSKVSSPQADEKNHEPRYICIPLTWRPKYHCLGKCHIGAELDQLYPALAHPPNPSIAVHIECHDQGCAYLRGWGGYEAQPPRIWENPGTQHYPTPMGRGGCWKANHPPSRQRHEHWTSFQKFQKFLKHMSSLCRHCLSHMMNRRSLSNLKNHRPHLRSLQAPSFF